ncbi:MAG: lysyl oxidase family protein, partial [Candidatus Binatia bacterium]
VRQLRHGRSVTIQWTGRLSAGGTMGFGAFVSANSPSGPVNSRMIDCGVTGPGMNSFDPTAFSGTCKLHPGPDGDMVIEVRNATTETLTNVEAFMMGRTATGNVQLSLVRGPAPRNVRSLAPGARRDFTFTGRFLGEGDITITFEARGSRSTEQRVVTAPIVCSAPVGGTPDSLPDLGVDEDDLRQSTLITTENFEADHCAVVEGCVDGLGARKLLRFNTTTPNYGPGDAFIGDPRSNPEMQYSSCHNHYHFKEYADYRLLDRLGNVVARGHKQAFCLVDLWAPPGLGGAAHAQFTHCGFQGISAGWADVYHRGLDCQWIDITAVPAGRYVLEVEVNPARALHELDYSNNVARTEVVVP